jgi:putative transposase
MRSTAFEFAALARSRDEFAGGMQWLKVKKWEYLTRYRRDPITGEQKAASIGRRSAETEAIYDRFIKGRGDLDRQIEALRPTMAEQTRMARALRLTRAPDEVGAVARAIGLSELIITFIGEAAIYAYECEMAALLPREILPDGGMDLLVAGVHPTDVIDELIAVLRRAKIDVQRAVFFRRSAHQGGIAERKAMIDREHDLPISKQAEALKISRGSVYYLPRPVSPKDLALMRRLDRLHLEFPFAGSRMLRGLLAAEGCKIGRRHVKTLMRRMGIEALYRRPRTTKPEPGHKIHPYLLRGMEITRPNQVWAMDITYIPMARGFVYLAVVLDWATRRVLSWRLSITMEAAFCVATLEDALARHGRPEIFNTDQGSQFTGAAFTGVLADNGIAISMDGQGAWRDNVFVERLWRSVKYEEVYLRAYDSVSDARNSIGRYLDFYNCRRPHSSLDGSTPDQAYFTSLPLRTAA